MNFEVLKTLTLKLSLILITLLICNGEGAFASALEQSENTSATATEQPEEVAAPQTDTPTPAQPEENVAPQTEAPAPAPVQPQEKTVIAPSVPTAAAAAAVQQSPQQPVVQTINVRMVKKTPEEIKAMTCQLCKTQPDLTPLGVLGIGAAAQGFMLYYGALTIGPALSVQNNSKAITSSAILLTVGSTGGSLLTWSVFRNRRCYTIGWFPLFAGSMGGSAASLGIIAMGLNGVFESDNAWWLTLLSTMALPAAGQLIAYLIARKPRFPDEEENGKLTSRGTIKLNDNIEYGLPGLALFPTSDNRATAGLSLGNLTF